MAGLPEKNWNKINFYHAKNSNSLGSAILKRGNPGIGESGNPGIRESGNRGIGESFEIGESRNYKRYRQNFYQAL